MLADNEMDIHQSRLVIWHTAWMLDQGRRGTHESRTAKVFCSEAIWRVVDRSMQILGGLGITTTQSSPASSARAPLPHL
jgi:acyl-CoA dehydrogenase